MGDLREQLQTTLGDSLILGRELGGGGMSRVFVAEERALGRQVVVKVLPHEMAAAVSIERFKREIALAARLQHPHIVPLHAAGESDGLPYFTMPLVEGESLRARLARGGELPIAEGVRILREVASALDYAHEKGIVHRDIKPDNVLLSRGSAMVTDFGVAKALSASSNAEHAGMTSLGVALGTPAYMSPEQAAAAPNIDARADIYAFGIMAYEMFAGRPPFAGRSPQAVLAAQVSETPESVQKLRSSLPVALSALVMRCLEKHPADRPQSAIEVVHALDAITTPSGGSAPTTAQRAVTSEPRVTTPASPRRLVWLIAGGPVVVFLLGLLLFKLFGGSVPARVAAYASAPKTMAVLPFSSGGDTATDYFADGISDEVRSELTKISGLSVTARSSSYRFKNSNTDAREIGRQLGVAAMLEGSVRRSGQRLRVTADLINVADASELWSGTYDGEAKDVFGLQDSITRAIAGALRTRFGDEKRTSSGVGTANLAAYDLYLRGRYLFERRGEQNLRQAAALFSQAASLDSTFARAPAGLSLALGILPGWSDVRPDSALNPAVEAGKRAIALDSTLADAFAGLGDAEWQLFQWADGERHLRRALELDPRHGSATKWLGELLVGTGRFDEGLALLKRATELDPLLPISWTTYSNALWAVGLDSAAIAAETHAIELDPSFYWALDNRALQYAIMNRPMLALRDLQAIPGGAVTSGLISLGLRAIVYARAGHRAEADSLTRILERQSGTASAASALADAYIGQGDYDKAIDWLIRSVRLGYCPQIYEPEFDPLRGRSRWRELIAAMKLENQPIATYQPKR